MKFLYIWERDLLYMAQCESGWRGRAHELGFTDKKIDAPWIHKDAGRLIEYDTIPSSR